MRLRGKAAGGSVAVLCTVVLAGALPSADAAPATCTVKCPSAKGGKGSKLAELRRQNARQRRPNVIVIDTDDMNSTDLWVMRNTLALLAGHGTTFENSYVSYPLCCPSRATFLTGQYAHNDGVTTDSVQAYGELNKTNNLAVWLKRAKYRTAMVGKYLNGYGVTNPREVPPGWSRWYGLTAGTEQKRYGFDLNENGKVKYYTRKPANYIDYVLDSKLNALLKKWTISPQPFFIYYNPNNPHGERNPPVWSTRDPEPAPQYVGYFGDATAPRPPNFDEADVSDKPQAIQQLPLLSDPELQDIDRRYRGRIESLLSVDDEVKRIVGLVRKYGDKQKTVFIFTSDNGLEMGAHRIEFKDYLYEEGVRVPLIIRGPGFPQNATRDQLVANIDLAPTITALTRVTPGDVMDGIPLLPLAKDPTTDANRTLLFESYDIGTYGVRQGQWAYNLWDNGDEELYNLTTDPYELNNLLPPPPHLTTPANRATGDQLKARLMQLRSCSGATCH
jgi:N-acetylglucosamine-6-sulfatase